MRSCPLLMSLSLLAIGLNLGFSLVPGSTLPVAAQAMASRAARLAGQEAGSRINVRSAPSTTAPIQHYGLVGDAIAVLQETKAADGYTWYFVQFPQSQSTGWVRGDFVAFSNSYSDIDRPLELLPDVGNLRLRAITYERSEAFDAPALEVAIARELSGNVANVRYLYNSIDLDNDGRYEVIAYLAGAGACGTGGCTMMIFTPTGAGTYQLISRHTLIRNPIVVSDAVTKGWRDIVVYVAGGGAKPAYRVLRFKGSTYPSNPSTAPVVPAGTTVSGRALISDQLGPSVGLPMPNRR